jgi:hypothetical protein
MESARPPEVRRVAMTAEPDREMTPAERDEWEAAERDQRGLGPDDMLIVLVFPRTDGSEADTPDLPTMDALGSGLN